MNTVCEHDMCNGCMACAESCKKGAITITDGIDVFNAVIDDGKCIGCNLCRRVCPQNDDMDFAKPIMWKQGWAVNEEERLKSSSGGLATAVAKSFADNGGIVCGCVFKNGSFSFDFATAREECGKFRGSKYVKSSPLGVYETIKNYLKEGKRVLFIGLPCQAAGVKKYVGKTLSDSLYTIDLICHGTPSPKLLEMYLNQEFSIKLTDLEKLGFRKGNFFGLFPEEKSMLPDGVADCYTMTFLKGIDYTKNCYSCKYAQLDRVSDLTLGDSWGSSLPENENKSGISLALCQSEKGSELLNIPTVHLEEVDLKKAVECNRQLNAPSAMPEQRSCFFEKIKRGDTFKSAARAALPKQVIKNDIKLFLFKMSGKKSKD